MIAKLYEVDLESRKLIIYKGDAVYSRISLPGSRPLCEIKKKHITGKLPDTAGGTGLLKFIQYWALENLLLSFWPSFHRKSCILGLNFSSDITSCVTLASCLILLRLHLSTGPKGLPTIYHLLLLDCIGCSEIWVLKYC